ncbi:MAG: bifunctional phosphoribosylaminoimidazolecarboxamide formyltransferase/IMP cyclohydrolase [Phycisphaerae bacterium]|nr:bifunctional phosphoribosylaminoimidazolecarboxamide formyltransferase/IMP cyclohydrolase [Phycisphaerae bacterium]
MLTIRRALIAVYDKTGIDAFARALVDEFGIEIISTGDTAKHLRGHDIPVTLVEEITGFPEMLDGRVKTLHPKVHAAILADRDNPEHMRQLAEHGIRPIDMVVVNLYPFSKTIADPQATPADAIEMIDIGGPCLLRAAAKNHEAVLAVVDPADYGVILEVLRAQKGVTGRFSRERAHQVYELTRDYDTSIACYLRERYGAGAPPVPNVPARPGLPPRIIASLEQLAELRYGENPHQRAGYFDVCGPQPATTAPRLRGAAVANAPGMSFNNFLDADAALRLCIELSAAHLTQRPRHGSRDEAVSVFVKHTNPCGIGIADDPVEAYRRAYLGDPNAAMGGILAVNFEVTPELARVVMETYDRFGKPLKNAGAAHAPGGFFVEVWLAPAFADGAVAIIRGRATPTATMPGPPRKKWGETARLLTIARLAEPRDLDELDYRSIAGGMLVQTSDLLGLNEDHWKVVTRRAPDDREMADLRLAWLIAKHTKSNAISICRDGMLIGNGAGQMSRIMSCRVATWLARENGHAHSLRGAVAASDAFFPFRDGPDLLSDAGVTAIIQPGGSKRDDETIAACDERDVAMIFTGTRHFRH